MLRLFAQTATRAALTTRAEEEERPALGGITPDTRTSSPRGEDTPSSSDTPCQDQVIRVKVWVWVSSVWITKNSSYLISHFKKDDA